MATGMKARTLLAIAAGLLAGPEAARAAGENQVVVESWVRPAGDATALEGASFKPTRVDLAALEQVEGRRFDAQYRKYLWFEGVPLTAVIARLKPPAAVDLALLHFANGMVVPLALADQHALEQLDPFIALRMRSSPKGSYAREFPPVMKRATDYADVRATQFSGNKLVVARLWHPALGEKLQTDFSPWALADSLVAIEFVQSAPYYKQFDVDASPQARAGLDLYRQSCQFCHGARKVGAKFGWDFVEPTPLYTYRKGEKRLYYHVAFRRYDAIQRGQNMPALKSMTEADAGNLWQWLKAIGTRPMAAYTPAAHTPGR